MPDNITKEAKLDPTHPELPILVPFGYAELTVLVLTRKGPTTFEARCADDSVQVFDSATDGEGVRVVVSIVCSSARGSFQGYDQKQFVVVVYDARY